MNESHDEDATGFRFPGRADLIGAASRLIWRRRNARDQRVAGEASAKNAVKIEGPAEPPVEEIGRAHV